LEIRRGAQDRNQKLEVSPHARRSQLSLDRRYFETFIDE
jgi:hypothetical protein